ncbi:MAG: DsbA family oxidoreductase [Propionivibrio sp.]|uniref:DsbA family oxidoreductase n=1 Tax=Propionivibrio sp. TaxID=2212460 RepID=UPI001A410021|nr:DsbA family oxidoreductase [Propionivibrio sp.]MBL8416204.1 DsbA family oxidoreductase [Propionivibrio sp.]
MNLAIDIVSDPVCPWCFIGKHRLTSALALVREKHPEVRFQFNWLPYFLNPDTPLRGEPYRAFLEAKFGGAQQVNTLQHEVAEAGRDAGVAGVHFNFERIAIRPNTMRAHRLIYRAQSIGHRPEDVDALVERLFIAHFQHGEDIGAIATLAEIAAECGDRKDHVIDYLESYEGTTQVRSLVGKVGDLGVSGVPFFLIQRRLAVAGAQSSVVLAAAILQAMNTH